MGEVELTITLKKQAQQGCVSNYPTRVKPLRKSKIQSAIIMQNSHWCREPSGAQLLWLGGNFFSVSSWKVKASIRNAATIARLSSGKDNDYDDDCFLNPTCSFIHCCPRVCLALDATTETTQFVFPGQQNLRED